MPTYKYTALSMSGKKITGVVEGFNELDAVDRIRQECPVILKIAEVTATHNLLAMEIGGNRLNTKAFTVMCSQFAIILKSGIPIARTVQLIAAKMADKKLKSILEQVAKDVESGRSLAASFAERGGKLFPPTFIETIRAGEETGSGAVLCRELIKEEGIQRIFAFHNLSGYPEGSIVYRPGLTQPASEGLKICFHGKTSHASAPEDGNNPSEAVANVILRAAELSKDRSAGMLLCTVTGIRLGSGDFGISPGEAEICMTLRAEEESRMKSLEEGIIAFAGEEGERRGIRISYSVHDYFPETRNDEECLKAALAAAEGLGLRRIPMDKMWRASEDFGWYLKECPGAIIYIGSGEEHPPLHTAEYDFNDRILETAVDLFAALSVLNAEDRV